MDTTINLNIHRPVMPIHNQKIMSEQDSGLRELHKQIKEGNVPNIRALVKADTEIVKQQDSEGNTAFHLTAQDNICTTL